MEQDIELTKLELEKARIEGELKLKAAELELQRAELEFKLENDRKKPLSSSPLAVAIITGIVGLISIGIANYLQSGANLRLEREKAESALILKAIETGDREVAAKNLAFLVQIGLIQDKTGRIAALEKSPSNAPVLPVQGRTFNPQEDCGLWRSETSEKQYTFICQNENRFDVYVSDPNEGLVKVGTGRFEKANVEADVYVKSKNRSAHLSLKLSDDGKTLEGIWTGLDPREYGRIRFRKVE
jgi:hypothetical protein